jgi:predicted HTH domain antitoxin
MEDIAEQLQAQWRDPPRHALEAIAAEGYRSGALSEEEARRVLGYETRTQVHAFLKEHGVPLHYTSSDLEEDRQTLSRLEL